MTLHMNLTMNLKDTIRNIPDFPKPGMMFRDVTTLMTNRKAFHAAVKQLAKPYKHLHIDNVAGVDARGLIFGAAVAYELGAGFVPLRKPGKLPFDTYTQDCNLADGSGQLEMHADAIRGQERVLLVDDLIASGDTAEAAIHLLRQSGADIVGAAFVVDLIYRGGLTRLTRMGVPVTALVTYNSDNGG